MGHRLWTSDQVDGWTLSPDTQSRIQFRKLASRFWISGLYDESVGRQDGCHNTREQQYGFSQHKVQCTKIRRRSGESARVIPDETDANLYRQIYTEKSVSCGRSAHVVRAATASGASDRMLLLGVPRWTSDMLFHKYRDFR